MQWPKIQRAMNSHRSRSRLQTAAHFRADAAGTPPMSRAGRALRIRSIRSTTSQLTAMCRRTPVRSAVHAAKPCDPDPASASDTSQARPAPRVPLGSVYQALPDAEAGQGGCVIRCRQRPLRCSEVVPTAMHSHIDRRLPGSARSVGQSVICAARRSQVADAFSVCRPEPSWEPDVFAQPHSEHNHLLP